MAALALRARVRGLGSPLEDASFDAAMSTYGLPAIADVDTAHGAIERRRRRPVHEVRAERIDTSRPALSLTIAER